MMSDSTAIDLIRTLRPEHQQQVVNLITYLKAREETDRVGHSSVDWEADPFFGIWTDKIDMQDSTEWVRQLRQDQWSRS